MKKAMRSVPSCLALLSASAAWAESRPVRPIRLIAPSSALPLRSSVRFAGCGTVGHVPDAHVRSSARFEGGLRIVSLRALVGGIIPNSPCSPLRLRSKGAITR